MEPVSLGLFPTIRKKFITVGKDLADFLEDIIQFDFDLFSVFLLFLFELRDQVAFLFVDGKKLFCGDFLALLVNFLGVLFELFEFIVKVMTASSAGSSEERVDVGFGAPFVPVDTGLDDFIGGLEVLCEEVSLVLVHEVNDLVVFADNYHGVFSEYS